MKQIPQDLIDFLKKYNVEFTQDGEYAVVGGDLYLSNNQLTTLPESIGNLKVGGGLDLYNNQLTTLPESIGNLKVGGDLYLYNNQLTTLPESIGNLKVGGNLHLSNNQLTTLPESIGNLKVGGNLHLSNNQLTNAKPKIQRFKEVEITDEYIYADDMLVWCDKVKTLGEYTLYIGEFLVVAQKGDTFSHGKTVKQAISDIIFKTSERDSTVYKNIDRDKAMPIEDAIVMYRTITGACSAGVEAYMRGKDWGETITVNKILSVLKSEYGSEQFRTFFN